MGRGFQKRALTTLKHTWMVFRLVRNDPGLLSNRTAAGLWRGLAEEEGRPKMCYTFIEDSDNVSFFNVDLVKLVYSHVILVFTSKSSRFTVHLCLFFIIIIIIYEELKHCKTKLIYRPEAHLAAVLCVCVCVCVCACMSETNACAFLLCEIIVIHCTTEGDE